MPTSRAAEMIVDPPTEPSFSEAQRQAALDSYDIVDSDFEEAYDDIVRLARALCDAPVATVTLIDRDRQWFKASIGMPVRETPRSESVCDVAIRTPGTMLEVPDLLEDARTPMRPVDAEGNPLRFYAGMPLRSPDGKALGTVCVLDNVPRTLTPAQRENLRALARQTQHLLELRRHTLQQSHILLLRMQDAERLEHARADLQRRHDDLKRVATHDPLTGLLNRAALQQLRSRPEAMEKLQASGYALGVIDIDHFKQVNDRHGHLIGDEALRAVADIIAASIRKDDIAVRYGGEEFLVVLLDTALSTAFEVAERIRHGVGRAPLPFSISVSVGLAAGNPATDTPEQVFERADQALYRAKAAGRNRVIADDTPRH